MDDIVGARHWGTVDDIQLSLFRVKASPFNTSKVYMPSVETPGAPASIWFANEIVSSLPTYNCQIENTCPNGIGIFGFVADDDR
jgi:hypothetical protein